MPKSLIAGAASLVVSAALLVVAPTAPAQAATTPVTAVTYNVRGCCNADNSLLTGSASWPSRLPVVVANLKTTGADVIALQESTPYNSRKGRVSTGIDRYPAKDVLAGLRKALPGKNYDLATAAGARAIIYSKAKLAKVAMPGVADRIDVVGTDTKQKKLGWNVLFKSVGTGKTFMVSTFHLTTGTTVAAERNRRQEIASVYRAVQPRAAKYAQSRTLYLGDFNTYPGYPTKTDSYGAGRWLAERPHVGDAYALAPTANRGTTKWSTYKGGFGPRTTGKKNYDRIFVDVGAPRSWSVLRWRTLSDLQARASDHWPVKVDMTL